MASVAFVAAAAVTFGILISQLMGNGAGLRDEIGNLSAPWLLVPFFASALTSRGRVGAGILAGDVASVLALTGIFVASSVVLQLGPHPCAWTRRPLACLRRRARPPSLVRSPCLSR
jgi:hypothetical protein